MNYPRLKKRAEYLREEIKDNYDSLKANEEHSICGLISEEGFRTYDDIRDIAVYKGITKVYDIGCAFGHQSEVFKDTGIEYVGINMSELPFWNREKDFTTYLTGLYPDDIDFEIERLVPDENSLAVSVLALGWECYFKNGSDTLKKQVFALGDDFNQCLLYLRNDKIKAFAKVFNNVDRNLGKKEMLHYFS